MLLSAPRARDFALVLALLLALGGLSCSSAALGRGIDDYHQARYPEALSELRRLDACLACLPRPEQARLFLYRGLTELALGNAWQAHRFLSTCKRLAAREPELLDREDHGRLSSAWRSLGKMPAELY